MMEWIRMLYADKMITRITFWNWHISVGMETELWTGRPMNPGLILSWDKKYFPSPQHPDWLWGPIQWVSGVMQL
jgi:hypothetical protein